MFWDWSFPSFLLDVLGLVVAAHNTPRGTVSCLFQCLYPFRFCCLLAPNPVSFVCWNRRAVCHVCPMGSSRRRSYNLRGRPMVWIDRPGGLVTSLEPTPQAFPFLHAGRVQAPTRAGSTVYRRTKGALHDSLARVPCDRLLVLSLSLSLSLSYTQSLTHRSIVT
jgi:hypothetical protein